jgi:hypothetical protein
MRTLLTRGGDFPRTLFTVNVEGITIQLLSGQTLKSTVAITCVILVMFFVSYGLLVNIILLIMFVLISWIDGEK